MEQPSISQAILFRSTAEVVALIEQGADVNEKDVYGLTPLIESVLKENLKIAALLLEHGARIDQHDISGQTALQWAVNRQVIAFVEFLLKQGADPNHYSADGQSILVNPILRNQKDFMELLVSFGADLSFALDFINAKLIGHRYELIGRAMILNPQKRFIDLSFEGFYLEFTVGLIAGTLIHFVNSDAGKNFNAFATVLSKIIRTLKAAATIVPYKYTVEGPSIHDKFIREVLTQDLVVIPVSYEGHAITFIKYGKLLAKCDRGVKHIVDTVIIYEIGNPNTANPDFFKDLMYNNKSNTYINEEVKKILDLKPLATLPARYQLSGNCSWANVEASVPAMMFMLMFKGNNESRGEIAALKKSIMNYYDTWIEWDKDRILKTELDAFSNESREKRIAKASILAAVLFQRCKTFHPKEVDRAKKILAILTLPEYEYILKTYVKVYYTRMAGKTGEDFIALLKTCGVDIKNLIEP